MTNQTLSHRCKTAGRSHSTLHEYVLYLSRNPTIYDDLKGVLDQDMYAQEHQRALPSFSTRVSVKGRTV